MAENEEKGFVIKDRRKVSLDDLGKESAAEGAAEEEKREHRGESRAEEKVKREFEEASRVSGEKGQMPLPEVSFSMFVFSLSSSALVHLGEIPDPGSQKVSTDLPLAKQIIDTLGILEEKTRGNLEADEDRLLKSVLYDLRLRFVQKSGTKRT